MASDEAVVFLDGLPTHFTRLPLDWKVVVDTPIDPISLGPFNPVAGSSGIYVIKTNSVDSRAPTAPRLCTLCVHLPIATLRRHIFSDPMGHVYRMISMLADSGRDVWCYCVWEAYPSRPGALQGILTKFIAFGRQPNGESGFFLGVLLSSISNPKTASLLYPASNYTQLLSQATPKSDTGIVKFFFYDFTSKRTLKPPVAGAQMLFWEYPLPLPRATPIILLEAQHEHRPKPTLEEEADKTEYFRGWVDLSAVDVLSGRVGKPGRRPGGRPFRRPDRCCFGTVVEAHPGVLPDGRQCISGLVTFKFGHWKRQG
ncbi:hypothetical protein BJ508DRAFT_315758 [Ascobolus immersus RN42]|uniref:Uncharacterized protein n=1 Tax=Ascobolus immersus RN42 TaxID=1160509 RepID=A0A3N4H9E1_ASCIM|nr:hypothetical protein BJ508DRAFT_315758 [Ascobolus immersus RN42]